ncbi:MAG: hypothetical protein ACSHXD_01885 [Marinosulfonomonas sp.]
MWDKQRITRTVAVLLAALAVGHFMQNGFAFAAKNPVNSDTGAGDKTSDAAIPGSVVLASLPTPPMEMIVPTGLPHATSKFLPGRRVASSDPTIDMSLHVDPNTPSLNEPSCEISVSATPRENAMVQLKVDAPCYRNQRVLIEHVGLKFADLTDAGGYFTTLVPVFDPYAAFSATFPDGNTAQAKTLGSSLGTNQRVALSWQGGPGFHIHALEFGADYGQRGDVWAEAPGNPEEAALKGSGYLMEFGNPYVLNPVLAEVYSYPDLPNQPAGAIRLIVEAEIGQSICGQDIQGNTLQTSTTGGVASTAITLAMPDCSGADGFLVLKNLLQDIKIAQK